MAHEGHTVSQSIEFHKLCWVLERHALTWEGSVGRTCLGLVQGTLSHAVENRKHAIVHPIPTVPSNSAIWRENVAQSLRPQRPEDRPPQPDPRRSRTRFASGDDDSLSSA